jgi:hypothetical protein
MLAQLLTSCKEEKTSTWTLCINRTKNSAKPSILLDTLSETTKNQAFSTKWFALLAYFQSVGSHFWSVMYLLYPLNLIAKTPLLRGFELTVQKTGRLNAQNFPFATQCPF